MSSSSQNATSFTKSITTEPNTPESSSSPKGEDEEEELSGDFARLTPSSKSARLAFHNLASAIKAKEHVDTYQWHQQFIHIRSSLQPLEDDEEDSTSADNISQDQPTVRIHNGFWRLNMDLRPAKPQYGWFIGRGRWHANAREPYGAVDILLT